MLSEEQKLHLMAAIYFAIGESQGLLLRTQQGEMTTREDLDEIAERLLGNIEKVFDKVQ